jgi:hypothetical protein
VLVLNAVITCFLLLQRYEFMSASSLSGGV